MFAVPWGCSAPPPVAPEIYSIVATTTGDTTVTITWSTDVDATSQVEYGTTTSYGSTTTKVATLTKVHSVALTDLTPGTDYYYRVISESEDEVEAKSSQKAFNTTELAISDVSVSASNRKATVTWTTDDPSSSQVKWGETSTYDEMSAVDATMVTSHSVVITGLASGTTYHYQVLSESASDDAVSDDDTFASAAAVTYTVGVPYTSASQNPYTNYFSATERAPRHLVYEPLIQADTWANLTPWLAESWEVNWDDPVQPHILFHLDPDAKWSDGQPVTAEDVEFSYETMAKARVSPYTYVARYAEADVIVVDDLTVRFDLHKISSNAVHLMGRCNIIPKHIWEDMVVWDDTEEVAHDVTEAKAYLNEDPVGSGPYSWTELEIGSHCSFEARDDYWRQDVPIDNVIMKVYSERESMLLALRAGDIDAVDTIVNYTALANLYKDENIDVFLNDRNSTISIFINERFEPANVKEFRQALNMGIDKQNIVDTAVFGFGAIAAQLPKHAWTCDHAQAPIATPDIVWPYTDNTQEERTALANAVLDDIDDMTTIAGGDGTYRHYKGEIVEFDVLYVSEIDSAQVASVVQQNAMDMGIRLNLVAKTANGIKSQVWTQFRNGNEESYEMFIFPGSATGAWEDYAAGYDSVGTTDSAMLTGWDHSAEAPAIMALFDEAITEMDPDALVDLIQEIQPLMVDQMVNIPLYNADYPTAARNDRFTGWIEDLCAINVVPPLPSIIQILQLEPIIQ